MSLQIVVFFVLFVFCRNEPVDTASQCDFWKVMAAFFTN